MTSGPRRADEAGKRDWLAVGVALTYLPLGLGFFAALIADSGGAPAWNTAADVGFAFSVPALALTACVLWREHRRR